METQKLALSVVETAERISVCTKTVWNLIKGGKLRAKKIGSRTVVLAADLEEFLRKAKSAG